MATPAFSLRARPVLASLADPGSGPGDLAPQHARARAERLFQLGGEGSVGKAKGAKKPREVRGNEYRGGAVAAAAGDTQSPGCGSVHAHSLFSPGIFFLLSNPV